MEEQEGIRDPHPPGHAQPGVGELRIAARDLQGEAGGSQERTRREVQDLVQEQER